MSSAPPTSRGLLGGGGDDILTGNAGDNTLYGFNGNDLASAAVAGNDSLVGHAGDDLLRGGAGIRATSTAVRERTPRPITTAPRR